MGRLQDKVAIVTGSSAGMGKSIVERFLEEGAKVVLADVNEEASQKLAEEHDQNGERTLVVKTDVTSQADIDELVSKSVEKFGQIDILINNAGIMDNFVTVGDLEDELWHRVLDINLNGPFKLSRAVINEFKKQGTKGVIVNNASVGGLFGARGGAAYVSSKHALLGLTKNMAATHGTFDNIRVNAIAPGGVHTDIQATIDNPHAQGLEAIKNCGPAESTDPVNIANVAVFLASDESEFVNGAIITADGGWTAG